MKNLVVIAICLFVSTSFSQNKRVLTENKDTNLIEVVYYHTNGEVSQTGSYTIDGKLQGDWLSFDINGKKIASATYDNGKKVGKWFFWNGDTLKEVDYSNNVIASVSEWSNKNTIVSRN
ncbi:nicotinic acid mononucleotide adenyltransferase [Subsaxibacter sp. CAU 1640]|uniref:toxin-antitoxin system YwqK family antitoxin n=1 Tax=Subsaxibacter sp. CAU 1640 TaxID=2933271 RepID=UPI002004F6A8|nr:nicotinic acid mononucleotide adenyltransferase [Subsaxibacter sp. CAU 1640]MCK7589250.1 nicotinic acid mononucleotide adenyltransferase [Subsaxibacter sp. CAU 1640]